MNQGFIGVNFDAEIEVPGYTDSMPNIVGKLEVNTINNWSFSVEGNASFLKSITLEVKLGFKSHNNVPIVDNLYFYIQGIKPGINLDSVGVSWLMVAVVALKICMIHCFVPVKFHRLGYF